MAQIWREGDVTGHFNIIKKNNCVIEKALSVLNKNQIIYHLDPSLDEWRIYLNLKKTNYFAYWINFGYPDNYLRGEVGDLATLFINDVF